jgi:hypothetical protein
VLRSEALASKRKSEGSGVVREPLFVSEPEDIVQNRVALNESTGGKRAYSPRGMGEAGTG